MAPKVQFTKNEIIDAAYKISIDERLSKLTVRKVASLLGCSVAPIYVNFKNSQALVDAVLVKITELVWTYLTKAYTDVGFLNIGIGQILFAKDYPELFSDILSSRSDCLSMDEGNQNRMLDIMGNDSMLEGLTREQNTMLLLKMSIFTHGISSSIANGLFPHGTDVVQLIDLLEETGFQLIEATKSGYIVEKGIKKI
jgi:AcrR family transcriptional regulator